MAREEKTASAAPEQIREGPHYHPDVDIVEQPDELRVRADLPGARREAIDVRLENGVLLLSARVPRRGGDGGAFLFQEYGIGDYYRAFAVGEGIDPARISAEYADGVLTVRLPKSESARPRRIQVQGKT